MNTCCVRNCKHLWLLAVKFWDEVGTVIILPPLWPAGLIPRLLEQGREGSGNGTTPVCIVAITINSVLVILAPFSVCPVGQEDRCAANSGTCDACISFSGDCVWCSLLPVSVWGLWFCIVTVHCWSTPGLYRGDLEEHTFSWVTT